MKIIAYNKIPDKEIRRVADEFKPILATWFENNPKRKICKIDWFYGRSIDVRRENHEARIDAEVAKLVNNAEHRAGDE